MLKPLDMESEEFKKELKKTKEFAKKVIENRNWAFNPDKEIVDTVLLGLTRNKLLYGKRFCPCFMVEQTEDGKYKSADDRICPCKPAINDEVPNKGMCHCGIFCSEEFVNKTSQNNTPQEVEEIVEVDENQAKETLTKEQLTGEELELLLKAREQGMIKFKLLDIREPFEWQMGRIKGADFLVPTSNFYVELEKVMPHKDEPWILYCHVGSRSAYVQRVLKSQEGFPHIGNLTYGIAAYKGEIIR